MTIVVPRFWLPPEESLNLADSGFLPDPGEGFGAAYNPSVLASSELPESGCLILIGEPGLGKSTALQAEADALHAQIDAGPDDVLAVDLGATGEETVLRQRIFEADEFRRW